MTLSYDVTGLKYVIPESLFVGDGEEATLNPMTKAVVEIAAYTGMNEITDKNVKEFHRRTAMLAVIGMMFLKDVGPEGQPTMRNPLLHELEMHVGLKINVDRLTATKFHNSFLTLIKEAANEFVRQEKELTHLAEAKAAENSTNMVEGTDNVIDSTDSKIWTPGDTE